MHQKVSPLEVRQRPGREPLEESVTVRRAQDLIERVGAARRPGAASHRQQMQIMIAEDDDGVVPKIAHQAQHFE